MTKSHSDDEPLTPEQQRAIRVILAAPFETDEDYINLARLIDDEVSRDDCD
jgi:hypothetical protein